MAPRRDQIWVSDPHELRRAGFSDDEVAVVTRALARNPVAITRYATAFELGRGRDAGESPLGHAVWMFIADICAAAIPVIPFVIFDIGTARIASLSVTTMLLLALGIGRGIIARKSVLATAAQTLAIAGAAALAGVAIGKLVTS